MTEISSNEGRREPFDICPGCGERMAKAGAVTVFCDEKGRPVELIRLCVGCAELFATGNAEERIGLFDRVGEVESAFFVCPVLEKRMAVH